MQAVNTNDQGAVEFPQEVPGLDVADALQRLAGNTELYTRLLETFVRAESDAAERLRAAYEAGDRTLAAQIAHGIKGVAANISAKTLASVAADINSMLRDDSSRSIGYVLPEFERALAEAVDSVGRLPQPAQSEPQFGSSPAVGSVALARLLDDLSAALQANDLVADQIFQEIVRAYDLSARQSEIAKIERSLQDLDFAAASDRVGTLRSALELG